jgi:hypothetical protein
MRQQQDVLAYARQQADELTNPALWGDDGWAGCRDRHHAIDTNAVTSARQYATVVALGNRRGPRRRPYSRDRLVWNLRLAHGYARRHLILQNR